MHPRRRRLVTPISFGLIREVYRGIYPSLEGSPALLATVRLVLAVAALAPATVLMGATFPSLTRYLTRTSALSRAFGRLYAANTIGAIVGTLAAGMVLIELLGLSGALAVGAACSAIAGVTALWLARSGGGEEGATAPAAPSPETVGGHPSGGAPGQAGPCRARAQTEARAHDRLHLGAHVARLPGHVDPAPRVRDRQHHVRLHGDPGDVPHRDRDRGPALQPHPLPARGSAAAPGAEPGGGRGAGAARPRVRDRPARGARPREARSRR